MTNLRRHLRGAALPAATFVLPVAYTACGAGQPQEAAESQETGQAQQTAAGPTYGMVIHGGAGTILRENLTPELEAQYRAKLTEAITAGYDVLSGGGTSLDAVEAAIRIMEDSPLFNAGKGAVFTSEGTNELDSSIMDGSTLQAGAVAGVKHVRHPITLARLVMEESPHVMMAGAGAEAFGQQHGIEMVPAEYFYTERRWQQLQEAKAAEARGEALRTDGASRSYLATGRGQGGDGDTSGGARTEDWKFGTVGAVALDQHGNLAAGTSTGGMTNKKFGRIGDSPIIGAGTYASNESCAVSATGHGEYFIRNVVAYDICARMVYTGATLEEAANAVIMEKLVARGGDGGVIAMDPQGSIVAVFNTPGMYRAWVEADGVVTVEIYGDE